MKSGSREEAGSGAEGGAPDRRQVLKRGAAASLMSLFPSCVAVRDRLDQSVPLPESGLVDAHCHVFNATDLPIVSFIHVVVRERYPRQRAVATRIEDPDWLDALVGFLAEIIGGGAPTAAEELAAFSGGRGVMVPRFDPVIQSDRNERELERVATALNRLRSMSDTGGPEVRSGARQTPVPGLVITAAKRQRLRQEIEREVGVSLAPGRRRDAVAQRLVHSQGFVGRHVRWALLFGRSRHDLVATLADHYKPAATRPLILAPALIDFSAWLDEQPRSKLRDQTALMGALARRPGPTRVHAYVAFDPMRDVLHRFGADPENPRTVVREAIAKHGFVGVKVYPPMGFRPIGNTGQGFPEGAAAKLERQTSEPWPAERIGRELDRSLRWLYEWTSTQKVVIISHATASQGAGPEYALRADPAHWVRVLDEFPRLRLILAHFGRFQHASQGPFCSGDHGPGPQRTWEHVIGCILRRSPSAAVFADLSYLIEVVGHDFVARERRKVLGRQFRSFIDAFDPGVDHLVFGSDWIMLARENGHERYHIELATFLQDEVGLDASRLRKVMTANPLKALGLDENGPGRRRLESFYRENRIAGHLPDWEKFA
jgi:hypothetical protein